MTFLELVRRRQSVRAYAPTPVPREVIERCLEAARLAPSACNSQPWFFVVVDEPGLRARVAQHLQDLIMNKFAVEAPVLIAVVAQTPPLIPRLAGLIKKKPRSGREEVAGDTALPARAPDDHAGLSAGRRFGAGKAA